MIPEFVRLFGRGNSFTCLFVKCDNCNEMPVYTEVKTLSFFGYCLVAGVRTSGSFTTNKIVIEGEKTHLIL